jgi:hypothetical protein
MGPSGDGVAMKLVVNTLLGVGIRSDRAQRGSLRFLEANYERLGRG